MFFSDASLSFWATVCKTVRPMLSVRCLSVCPVCNVGVLWPNGWTDPDETWRAGRPRPWPHCVRWGPSSPSPKGHSHILAHICCGQMARWIQMPLGTEVGLGPGHIVLDGPSPPQKKGGRGAQPPIFGLYLLWPNGRPSQLLLNTCHFKQDFMWTSSVRIGPSTKLWLSTLAGISRMSGAAVKRR